jgi:hypothetical protein
MNNKSWKAIIWTVIILVIVGLIPAFAFNAGCNLAL